MLKTKEEIQAWLDKMEIKNYTINSDLTVDVDGVDGVGLLWRKLTKIPVQFGVVKDIFSVYGNKLTSLKGSPRECRVFNCVDNELTSLEFAPEKCVHFHCGYNKLTSLEGAPKHCESIDCRNNQLTSLESAPEYCERIDCSNNPLTSLEGAPKGAKIISNHLETKKEMPEITDEDEFEQFIDDYDIASDFAKALKNGGKIDSIEIIDEFTDDHLPCVNFIAKVGGKEYKATSWYTNLKLFYKAETGNRKHLDQLKEYVLQRVEDGGGSYDDKIVESLKPTRLSKFRI